MKKHKRLIAFTAIIFITIVSFGQNKKCFKEINSLLKEQESSWNQGNIQAYMLHYWQSDSMMFVSKNGVTYGWKQTLDNYLKSYPDRVAMGMLLFDNLNFQFINKRNVLVIGSWHLSREKGDIGGNFSLLWRKIKGKWKIIIDHTS